MRDKLHDKFLLNFLARDKKNAEDIMEAGGGFVIPGIDSNQYESAEAAVTEINQMKTVASTVSVALGGGGNINNWKKALDIAANANAGHLNQPFETAAYSQGYIAGKGSKQMINALVQPTGEVGIIKLARSGKVYQVDHILDIAASLGIESIKLMPINGTNHLDELIYVTKMAQEKGICGVEPAGGITLNNIKEIFESVKSIDIEFFMPHIFGATIDSKTGNTIPEMVKKIYKKVEG